MRSATRVLTIALISSIIVTGGAGASSGFGDVGHGTWYEEPVTWLVDNEITTGVEPGCFAPDDTVTRGQVAAFLFRLDTALGGSPSGSAHPFGDVVADYQQLAVAWMYENQITIGTSPTSFSPDDPVTRGQFAALLWRYAGRPDPAGPHQFADIAAAWQQTAVAWMAGADITTGTTPSTFSPDFVMTRAEAATFIWRFVGSPAPVPADDIPCTRELRQALVDGGLTVPEATCAIDYLSNFTVEDLTDVLIGSTFPSVEMIVAISAAATECLTPDRVDELTRLLF